VNFIIRMIASNCIKLYHKFYINQTFHQPIETEEQNQFKLITFTARGEFLAVCKQTHKKLQFKNFANNSIWRQNFKPTKYTMATMRDKDERSERVKFIFI